jgi:hypothetical protein
MARLPSGSPWLVPMTIKIDPRVKAQIAAMSKKERRSTSNVAACFIEYGLEKAKQTSLMRVIVELQAHLPGRLGDA